MTDTMVNQVEQDNVNLQNYWQVLKRRSPVIVLVVGSVMGLSAFYNLRQKAVYEAQGKLILNKESGISPLTGLGGKAGELTGLTNSSNPLETEAEIIRSNPIVEKTIEKLQLKDGQGKPLEIDDFLKSLQVTSVAGTDVMRLSFRSTSSQQAANVINTLMNVYLESNVRANRSKATAAREFLDKQLPQIEKRVVEAEAALRRFKDQNRVVSLDEEAKVGVEALRNITEEITKTEAEIKDSTARSLALQNQLRLTTPKAVNISTISQSTAVQQVLVEYQKVQNELAVLLTRLTEEHPQVVNLRDKEEALRQQLSKRVTETVGASESLAPKDLQVGQLAQNLTAELVNSEVTTLALTNRLQVLRKAFLNQQGRLRVLPKLEQQQRALERKLQVPQTTYQQVLKQLQEVEVAEKQQVGNARIVSTALVPKAAISASLTRNLALAGFLGTVLGVASALALESLDKRLKSLTQVKQLFGYPLLGTIPKLTKKSKNDEVSELATRDNPYSPVSAAFEMLMTNLAFTISDKQLQVVVVSSSVPDEGKSFVAANLAVAKAQMGAKVLLIDADMRHPRQHHLWELHNLTGLSNVLVGQNELSNSAQEALVGLDILTAGTIPPNPLALIDSQRMKALLKEAVKEYDFVIIDTPPITAASEAQVLGKLGDGMLLVARPGILESDAANVVKAQIQQSGQRMLGIVVNGVTSESSAGHYYHKSYYGGQKLSKKAEKKLLGTGQTVIQ
jgi:capsular exopolysaccharide synthesis family protein